MCLSPARSQERNILSRFFHQRKELFLVSCTNCLQSKMVSRKVCCHCNWKGLCKGCTCVMSGLFCSDCLPSRLGQCQNQFLPLSHLRVFIIKLCQCCQTFPQCLIPHLLGISSLVLSVCLCWETAMISQFIGDIIFLNYSMACLAINLWPNCQGYYVLMRRVQP